MLSIGLFGKAITLPDFPADRRLKGVGLSDWEGYAGLLAEKFDYVNTQFHTRPRLDITRPGRRYRNLDFLVSTDVFEHVAPPISRAFHGAFGLLKPGGCFILSVPYAMQPETIEHFPDLYRFKIVQEEGKPILYNRTRWLRRQQRFDNLKFHGGAGATLEMRLFSKNGLIKELRDAGFREIEFSDQSPEEGIVFENPCGFPLIARKP